MSDAASNPGPFTTVPGRAVRCVRRSRVWLKWAHLKSSQSSRKSRSRRGPGQTRQDVRLANRLGRRGVCAAL